MFNLRETLLKASEALRAEKIEHALIGGFALAFYGVNRATADVDFLAEGSRRVDILRCLQAKGFKSIHQTSEVLQFTGVGNLDVLLANRPLSQQMLKTARLQTSLPIHVLGPEDIVGLKIQAYCNDQKRELQDKADILGVFRAQSNLDWEKIKKYADLFGQWDVIQELKGRI